MSLEIAHLNDMQDMSWKSIEHWLEADKRHVYIGGRVNNDKGATESKWANPYTQGKTGDVLDAYERHIRDFGLYEQLDELEGKIAACWCHQNPCHGQVLQKLLKERKSDEWDVQLAPLSERLEIVLNTLVIFQKDYKILPQPGEVFEMFRVIKPSGVRAVFIGNSPYYGFCPYTKIAYACGIAFMPKKGCASTPKTLNIIIKELCRDLNIHKMLLAPRAMLFNWISQGVMLLNASLTIGYDCPEDVRDHGLLWEEFMRGAISRIASACDNPVFVLIGKDAWKFEACINDCPRIMVSHPVARNAPKNPWIGSSVFTRTSDILRSLGKQDIKWV